MPAEGCIGVLDYPSNDKYFTMRYPLIRTSEWVPVRGYFYLGEEYSIVDEPFLGYQCHLNKLSYGWRPLFQKHKAFDSFRKLEEFYREHQADLEIYDEYGKKYSWEEYFETVYEHSRRSTEPVKWVYEVDPMFSSKEPSLHTVSCCEDEAELYVPFNHMEYEETLNKARSKFCVYERRYGEEKYWNDPKYLFDWTEGEFM